MKRTVLAALAATAVLGTAPFPAGAAQTTTSFGPLSAEVAARIAALPDPPATAADRKALKALVKVRDLLAAEPAVPGLGSDAKLAGTVDRVLTKAFKGDTAMDGILEGLSSSLVADIQPLFEGLGLTMDAFPLPDTKPNRKLAKTRAAAVKKLALVGAAPTRAKRLKALKTVAAGTDQILEAVAAAMEAELGPSGFTATVDGVPFEAEVLVTPVYRYDAGTGFATEIVLDGTMFPPPEGRRHLILFLGAGPGGGGMPNGSIRTLGGTPAETPFYDDAPPPRRATIDSGTCTLYLSHPRAGILAGSFSFAGTWDTGGTVQVTGGRFFLRGVAGEPNP